jgi:hypothetical protein
MTTLIERVIDTSMLRVKTTAAEQSVAQSNLEAMVLPANLALTALPNAQCRMLEQEDHSANQDLLILSYSSHPSVYDSLISLPDLRPISSKPTLGADSTTSIANTFDLPTHEAVPSVHQNDGNNLSRIGDQGEATILISTSSKSKQRATYPENDADDYQDSRTYQ